MTRPPSRNLRPLLLLVCALALTVLLASADAFGRAGGGGGYHGGGGGGGHSGGGGGHGGGGSIFDVIYIIMFIFQHPICSLVIVAIIVGFYYFGGGSDNKSSARPLAHQMQKVSERERALTALQSHDPAFTELQFIKRVLVAFDKIQAAWCAQDLRTVRPFISDGVHERFSLQFQEQKAEGYRDHMEDIHVTGAHLVALSSPGMFDEVSVRIDARAKDWRESLKDGTRMSGSLLAEPFTEVWTFLRKRGAATVASKPGLIEGNCPNCGAAIEMNQSANCAHCTALLRSGTFDWVLSEITQISEWNVRSNEALPGVAQLRERDRDFDVAAMEDIASVVYWRKATADRTGKIDALAKIALPQFAEAYATTALRAPPGQPRPFIADSAVGSVDLLGVFSDGQWDRALVEIRWSGQWFTSDPSNPMRRTGREAWAATMFLLARQSTTRTDPARAISSAHCPSCGAPESTSASNACDFCGMVLNDGSVGWVLEDVRDKNDPAAREWWDRMQAANG